MGGTIVAQSPAVRRRGTRFVVRLPAAQAASDRGEPGRMTGPRVLVVDDEPQIQRFLTVALTAAGFQVQTAETGAQALRLAATGAPDLIVLDLGLPDRDGKDVLRDIRQFSTTPVIVLSARDREAEKIEALDLGADDYVEKPFGIGELTARLQGGAATRGASRRSPPSGSRSRASSWTSTSVSSPATERRSS